MAMTRTKAIKTFFEQDGGKTVSNRELIDYKKEAPESYAELGDMAIAALGETLQEA